MSLSLQLAKGELRTPAIRSLAYRQYISAPSLLLTGLPAKK